VLGGWWHYQRSVWDFHRGLDAAHPYLSRPYGWLLLARPVAYYYASPKTCGTDTCSQEVLGVGTPAIWWVAIPALIAVGWRLVSRFDWRAAAILVSFLAGYLPWFLEDREHRTMFLFYLLPSVPFMVLAITMAIGMLIGSRTAQRSERRRLIALALTGAYLVGVVANFSYLRPVLNGQVITYEQWHDRMWLDWGCSGQGDDRNQEHELAPCWI
jgi:dolichyl-phosphate-mannose--protein O-mannosyl transferase